jgi:hypothetical protein
MGASGYGCVECEILILLCPNFRRDKSVVRDMANDGQLKWLRLNINVGKEAGVPEPAERDAANLKHANIMPSGQRSRSRPST